MIGLIADLTIAIKTSVKIVNWMATTEPRFTPPIASGGSAISAASPQIINRSIPSRSLSAGLNVVPIVAVTVCGALKRNKAIDRWDFFSEVTSRGGAILNELRCSRYRPQPCSSSPRDSMDDSQGCEVLCG